MNTIKIQVTHPYKSITEQCEFELPSFCVLTGKNGSGKTHLLEAISKRLANISINGIPVTENGIKYIGFNSLIPRITEKCDSQSVGRSIKNTWEGFRRHLQDDLIKYKTDKGRSDRVIRRFGGIDSSDGKLLNKILKNSKKSINNLTENDFIKHFDPSLLTSNTFFTVDLSFIFKSYHKKQLENYINGYYRAKKISQSPVLTEKEFKEKYGQPPWDFINKILADIDIPYEVNNPEGDRLETDFILKLKDKKTGVEISSNDLSTGEKTLMSLALAVYNTRLDCKKPELLLLDEPDAGLHPSMSKIMVKVLKENIVEQNGIPVIITTHSPTTIIATEGISIYQSIRGENIPKPIPVQEAVEILSSDIPFLRVSTENRRQVFVESKYDVIFYELLANIYRRQLQLNSEPIFIPAKTSPGSSCTDVSDTVKNLYSNGNDQVYGIIDWDLHNKSKDRVLVLGEDRRYAIENYLLDPLLMGLFLIRENKLKVNAFSGLSITTYAQTTTLELSDAQLIIDKILNELDLQSTNKVKYKTFNGWELETTKEFNVHQGHSLEKLYKTKFPPLKSYQREDALKKDIIEKVINDHPNFAPVELSDIILRIK